MAENTATPVKHRVDVIDTEVISTDPNTGEDWLDGHTFRAECDCGWSSIEHATNEKAVVHGWLHVQIKAMDEET